MKEKTTLQNLESIFEIFNDMIKQSNLKIVLGQRYGKKAIDLYSVDGKMDNTIIAGLTAGEVWDYINAMLRGIELFTKVVR
jgi:hypothetical protein